MGGYINEQLSILFYGFYHHTDPLHWLSAVDCDVGVHGDKTMTAEKESCGRTAVDIQPSIYSDNQMRVVD